MANAVTLKPARPGIPAAAPVDPPPSPAPSFAMLSHPGLVRHANQDACAALPEQGAFVVCDGVGGAAAGEVASHLAGEVFLNSLGLRAHSARAARPAPYAPGNDAAILAPYPQNHPHTRLQQAVRAANHAVFQRAQRSRALHGMGTTLVAVLLEDVAVPLQDVALRADAPSRPLTLWLAHVGDSRCYLFRGGALRLLTEDHSLVEEQVRAGQLTRAQAAASPIRNIITRAIGAQPTVEPEIAAHPIQPGDIFLLASDGLTRELDDDAIAHILSQTLSQILAHSPPVRSALEPACQALIDAAIARGGRDNITVLLVACP